MVVGIAWNAGAVRARLLGRHRLGPEGVLDVARRAGLGEALAVLGEGPYRHDVRQGMSLEAAQWAAAATPLWHLRVLAGWLPPRGGDLARTLAGWWEVLNVENLLAQLAGEPSLPPYELGTLGTAWSRVRGAGSAAAVRERLAASPWLDPGADDAAAIVTWLRLSWAARVTDEAEDAARAATGWAVLTAAADVLVGDRTRAGRPGVPGLGAGWAEAEDLRGFVRALPRQAARVLDDVAEPADLWRAEVRWWRGLDDEGERLLRRAGSGEAAVVGAFALLLADAHRVQGAIEVAARGGADSPEGGEVVRDAF